MARIEHKQLVIVGYGPAGLGASLAAYESGLRGIVAVDPGKRLGVGGLDGLDILSNSKGCDFTELLPVLLPEAANTKPAIELSQIPSLVDLSLAAELLDQVARVAVEKEVVQVVNEPVVKVNRLANGYLVRTPSHTVQAERLVLAPGGEEILLDEIAERSRDILSAPVFTSREILANRRNDELIAALGANYRVAIIGDSHGAYSVADKLLKNYPGIQIDFYKHSKTKPFFESLNEAAQYGYEITLTDELCPETGFVNRFGGIRGQARDLWMREQSGALDGCVCTHYNVPLAEIDPQVAIIQSTGYKPRRVAIFDSDNKPIDYVTRSVREGFANIYEGNNGPSLFRAFAIGIGHSSVDATTIYQKQARSAFELMN